MTIKLSDALYSLRPNSEWTCGDTYSSIVWFPTNTETIPTEQELLAEMARLEQVYINNEYQRLRAREYPTWEDQMDLLYHGGYDGWRAAITAIKNKYPKPGE